MKEFAALVAQRLGIRTAQAEAVLILMEEGATIPFIARYRKDRTGGLDEVQIQAVQDTAAALKALHDRRAFIRQAITDQGKMTDAIEQALTDADSLTVLEDIYLPYKPKRKTKAQAARENGLEPLAQRMLEPDGTDLMELAAGFITETVNSPEAALQGARDIVAETIQEDADMRGRLRRLFEASATLDSAVLAGKETEGVKYRDYFAFSEPIKTLPSHRILAILRGFLEGFLRIQIAPPEADALALIEKEYLKGSGFAAEQLQKAIRDAYRRLLQPALETECRTALKQKADEDAIQVFAENLRQLLLGAPLGSKKILAIDPGYRTGCKIVCLDAQGQLLHTDLIFIHENNKKQAAEATIRHLVKQYGTEAIAIGDGTAGRETEQFLQSLSLNIPLFLVNEDGASVYSASETAREEFPDKDVTVRGAVSIGRRLMDPLAELVKIDPKSIGVGQYQHDVNAVRLKEKLDQTVVSCVNTVGVNLNTASKHLLAYVSGIGPSLADNIIAYRNSVQRFESREDLRQVPRLGAKAYEQCAGFLRITGGKHPLDNSAVHPEAYGIVGTMVKDLGVDLSVMVGNETLLKQLDPKKYANESAGLMTIQDILAELRKPGLDPRATIENFSFAPVYSIEEVLPGMILPGIVTNLTRFGAFVDIGVKQDGLVHVSEVAHRYISDPSEVLKLGQKVTVKVLEVDVPRKRIALSIKQTQEAPQKMNKQPNRKQEKRAPVPERSVEDALMQLKQKFKR